MTSLSRSLVLPAMMLAAMSADAQLAPASAAPQTTQQPSLRADSKPNTSLTPATDSGPLPETLGADSTPLMGLGQDWSISEAENQPSTRTVLKMHKGQTVVSSVQTQPAKVLPVTNPPEPPTLRLENIPLPPVKHMPTPPDPLAAVPQPPPGI